MVLLHGAASNHTRWSEFLAGTALRKSWDILRPDLRGHGDSMCHGRLSLEIWHRDLMELLERVTGEPALLVGHSLGAQIAAFSAQAEPERIAGAVLIDPVFNQALTGTSRAVYRLRHLLRALIWGLRILNAAGLHRRHYPPRDLARLDNEVRDLLGRGRHDEFVRRYSSPWPNLRHVPVANYLQDILETLRPLPDFTTLKIPLLVILARAPTFADPGIARRITATSPRASLEYIEAYHWPLTEKPEATRTAVEVWCENYFH